MSEKQREQFNRMHATLGNIAKGYLTTDQLRKQSQKLYGLSYPESLEMAYENIQEEAKAAIKGVRKVQ